MSILDWSIIIFVLMESANVIILYFFPDFKYGNGIAVFNQWSKTQKDPSARLFASYLVNWVAGTKLIFIVLLLVILFTGGEFTKQLAVAAMILSISTYFWRLHAIIKKLDEMGEITPKGYSKGLDMMIAGFMGMFTLAFIISFFV